VNRERAPIRAHAPVPKSIALVAAALASAAFFTHPGARALLAGPALLLGLGFLALGLRDLPARHSME